MKKGAKKGRGRSKGETDNPLAERDIMDEIPAPEPEQVPEEEPAEDNQSDEAAMGESTDDGGESDDGPLVLEEVGDSAAKSAPKAKAKKKKKPPKQKRDKTPREVGITFLGMPLFAPKLLRVYFTLTLIFNLTMLAFMWVIQMELHAGDGYTVALMFGGVLVGLQLSNFSAHWKAGAEASASWMTAETVRGHVLRWERQKWHTKMIFYPIMVLIVLTVIYNFGVYTLVIHFTGETGECPTGILQGIAMFDSSGNGLLLLGGFTAMFVGMLVFMSLLSITHFKQYMKLHLFRLANPVEMEGADEEDNGSVGLNSGLFRASFIRRTYLLSIVAQGMILAALSAGKEATSEPNLLYSTLMFGIFLLGWQVGVGERHLHFDSSVEPTAEDESLIRDRVEWHGSMMFYPCTVSIAQCFYNFSALFTLLPYFATTCEAQTIGDVMEGLNSVGWLIFGSNAVLFGVAMSSLIFLCLLHFVQFQRYQMILDT